MNLRSIRMGLDLSQADIASKVGVSQQAVAKWENGESFPTADKLPKLARILGTTVDDLLADDTNNEKEEQNNGR